MRDEPKVGPIIGQTIPRPPSGFRRARLHPPAIDPDVRRHAKIAENAAVRQLRELHIVTVADVASPLRAARAGAFRASDYPFRRRS